MLGTRDIEIMAV